VVDEYPHAIDALRRSLHAFQDVEVWGFTDVGGAGVVRQTVYRLRRKLEQDPSHPRLLHTVAGVGVLLKPPQHIQ
jgi:DNA-binding response OmpR family regulator